jgi:hypothetical protein
MNKRYINMMNFNKNTKNNKQSLSNQAIINKKQTLNNF